MRLHIERWSWLRYLAVAILYMAVYTLLHRVSFSFWVLTAGFRVLCLLFTPYRYWPTLLLAEMAMLGEVSYACYQERGLGFALLNLVPPLAIAMPIMAWGRSRLGLIDAKHHVRIGSFILCTLLISVLTAAYNFLLLAVILAPMHKVAPFTSAQGYFLGNYLGILTLVPTALVLITIGRETPRHAWWARLSHSRLTLESVALLMPTLLLLMWIASHVAGDVAQAARIGMFLPVAALAMRHGWRGAAIGGTLASIAVVAVMPHLRDPATVQAEVFIAFTITSMLMLGTRITVLHAREEKEKQEGRLALQAAQEGLYLGELRLQHAADRIEDIGHTIRFAHDRLLRHVHQLLPLYEESGIQKQVVATQHEIFHLADGMHPRGLAQNGLSFVLKQGTLAQAFGRELVPYRCEIRGGTLAELSPGAQLALYRLACEAAIYIYEQATLSHMTVRVRTGTTGSRHWAVLQMEGSHARNREGPMPSHAECQQFRERLSANGRGMEDIRNRTRVYGGAARSRCTTNGTRLSLLLHDVERTSALH